MQKKLNILPLLLLAATLLPGMAPAAVIDDRINERLDWYIGHPGENPASPDPAIWTWGQAGVAMATFKRYPAAGNLATAQTYVNNLCNLENPLPGSDAQIYFKIPLLVRIYMDPAMNALLTQANKDNLERVLWQFTKSECLLTAAKGTAWSIIDSENHDMIRKSTWMLACQALRTAGAPYGGSLLLDDGNSIDTHYAAWKQYFFEFFRQRAREGLNCEIASPPYSRYTVGCWYNIRDLSDDANLRALADKVLTLFWADAANDVLPATGYRGVSGTRWYKNMTANAGDSSRDILYCYDWHDTVVGVLTFNTLVASSPYRPPAIVGMIGGDPNRPAYLSTSRRFGKGPAWVNGVYSVLFDANHASNIRRDTWWNPNYAMGGLTLQTASDAYIALIDQNRSMGVFFSNQADKGDRIMFFGNGTRVQPDRPPPYQDGDAEISGLCGKRCLVAAWDKNAAQNNGVRVFISAGSLLTRKVANNGWIFTWLEGAFEDVYVGIRICNGSYTTTTDAVGNNLLEFTDKFSPVIIEVASETESGGLTFAGFQTACVNQWNATGTYDTVAKKLTYRSLANDLYEYWANSGTLPKKNGATISLNPARTYNSPYLTMEHGSDLATIMYPGQPNLVLDFNFKDSPRWDDYQTKALWHMDVLSSGKVLDDDKFNTSRNNDLTLFGGATISVLGSKFSNGLILNGTNGYGKAAVNWAAHPTAKIDFWFRPTTSPTTERTIVTAGTTWDVRQINNDVKFYIWTATSGFFPPYVQVPNGATPNVWHHVTATVGASGAITLEVDNLPKVTGGNGEPMNLNVAPITVGNKEGQARWFQGMIDDLKIRVNNLQ
jgi:hypothetical protein